MVPPVTLCSGKRLSCAVLGVASPLDWSLVRPDNNTQASDKINFVGGPSGSKTQLLSAPKKLDQAMKIPTNADIQVAERFSEALEAGVYMNNVPIRIGTMKDCLLSP